VQVVLVHHADAVGPDVDPQRPLSSRGLAQAGALADAARAFGVRPDAIWHSGKLRARQTAEFFLRACNPMAEFRMVRGLLPDDPPEWMRDELAHETRAVLLAGHMPHISRLLAMLAPDAASFPAHGAVVLERGEDAEWKEVWRGE
jgi:phosphohistidine phosphatase